MTTDSHSLAPGPGLLHAGSGETANEYPLLRLGRADRTRDGAACIILAVYLVALCAWHLAAAWPNFVEAIR